jgi:hypothetical protein
MHNRQSSNHDQIASLADLVNTNNARTNYLTSPASLSQLGLLPLFRPL